MSGFWRYFHTVRYLRPIQIAGRAWYLLYSPRPDLRAAPPTRSWSRTFADPVAPASTLVAPGVFRFLGAERDCEQPLDWQRSDVAKLWVYNLHYFDDLNASGSAGRADWHRDLLERWVAENPPGQGIGWEPYPLSRRIVNWVKWTAHGNRLPSACHASLAVQARWLLKRVEYHLLGNHLIANAKALVFAGLFFAGPEAERWRTKGMSILQREFEEQILPDGGHFELSPMYHCLVLEDALDLINLLQANRQVVPEFWFSTVESMRRWLRVMCHPDGDISFFNDAAIGIAPSLMELEAYADRLGLGQAVARAVPSTAVLEDSGYVRGVAGPAYLLCDCARVGPDYLPAHAHADTLSFELSLRNKRVFVNSGTSRYGLGAERNRERGTPAHNTVVIDDENSSEVWGGFRVARRARPKLHVTSTAAHTMIEGSHDGYRRLSGRNDHLRRWHLDAQELHIEDHISGEFQSAAAYFHLHPEIDVAHTGDNEFALKSSARTEARLVFDDVSAVDVRPDTWHPHFGVSIESRCIIAHISGSSLVTHIFWEGS